MVQRPLRFGWQDLVVLVAFECIAVPICIAAGEAFVSEHYGRAFFGWLVGIPLALAGFTAPWWKELLGEDARQQLTAQMHRWWPAAVFLAFIFVTGPEMYRRATQPTVPISAASPVPALAPPQSQSAPTIRPPIADISGDLTILSNEEVRASAYVLATQVDDYLNGYIAKLGDINRNQSISDVERGTLKLQLDTAYNKDFRIKFVYNVLKVQTELRRRLKEKDPSPLPYIEFPNGILGIGEMSTAASVLARLAKMLP